MEIFKLFGSIFVDSAAAQESISKTEKKAESFGSKLGKGIKTAAKWGAVVVGAATAVGAGMMGMATKSAEATDRIDKLSQKIGMSRETFQEFDFICSQSGMSVEQLQGGFKTLTAQIDAVTEGNVKASANFEKLGVSIKNSDGSLRSQEEVFEDTLVALQNMEDGTEKARLATEIFGRSGSELMPLLNGAAGSIDEMKAKAQELGLVMSDEAIDAGVQFTDTMDQLKRSFGAVGTEVGVAFMPIIQGIAAWIVENMPAIKENIGKAVDFIMNVVDGLKAFWEENGAAITEVTSFIFENIKKIIKVAMDIIKNIIDVVMGLISGDWSKVWEGLKGILEGVFELIKTVLKMQLDALVNIVKGIGSLLYDAGKSIFNSLWDGIKSIWEGISSWVSDKVSWIADKVTFWNNSKDEMKDDDNGELSKKDGSHAAGLAYVPYDGYLAELHKGERAVNAYDNKKYNQTQAGGNYNFTFNSPKAMSPAEAAKESKKMLRQIQLGF